jgi:hypothetical protein
MHTYNIYVYIYIHIYLDGGLEHEWMMFPFHIWDGILPMDELICFKMVQPTNQNMTRLKFGAFLKLEIHDPNGCHMGLSENMVARIQRFIFIIS